MRVRESIRPALACWLCVVGAHAQAPATKRLAPVLGKQTPSSYLPTALHLYIGGAILLNNYWVESRGETLIYTAEVPDRTTNSAKKVTKTITPSARQWLLFWKAMDDVRVWQWQSDYDLPGLADGTYWQIDTAFAGRRITSRGHNNYPVAVDPETGQHFAKNGTFDRYLKAVEALLGGEVFR
jgi:hypothetical protein